MDATADDEEWPCASCVARREPDREPLAARTRRQCLRRISSPEPLNTSEPSDLRGSVAQWTWLRASGQCDECPQ